MSTKAKKRKKRRVNGEFDHDPICHGEIVETPIDNIWPAPENELLYRTISPTDPEIISLAESIRKLGVMEAIVISLDGYILSGHRRHMAARLAELETVPARVENIRRTDPNFIAMLREYNRQRVKTLVEVTREEVISADPEESYRLLVEHRREKSRVEAPDAIEIIGHKHRAEITEAKRPFLDAILAILSGLEEFWPLSVRQVHYQLLNDPPLIHAGKKESRYSNTLQSYKSAVDLITRARIARAIPCNAIDDETRPIDLWEVYPSIAPFVRHQLDSFLKGYYRDLQQSQPNQIEIVGEKNTIASIIRPVASEYCIPLTIGRGYTSLPPREKMARRFHRSGKDKLIVLAASDFDPEGEDIAHSFARSMRDDFGIKNIVPIKVALTREQIDAMGLPPMMKAKKTSSRRDRFVERHGEDVFELEAIPPGELQRMLRETIDGVLDIKAFNGEINLEKQDAAHLDAVRRAVQSQLAELNLEGP